MQFMTRKEVYEKVMNHLASMPQRSVGDDGKCAYRGKDGRMCAVGCLIPDSVYHKDIEGTSAWWLCGKLLQGVDTHDIDLLSFLAESQRAHDKPENWRPHRKGMYAKVYNGLAKYAKGIGIIG